MKYLFCMEKNVSYLREGQQEEGDIQYSLHRVLRFMFCLKNNHPPWFYTNFNKTWNHALNYQSVLECFFVFPAVCRSRLMTKREGKMALESSDQGETLAHCALPVRDICQSLVLWQGEIQATGVCLSHDRNCVEIGS
jgi:hypothetical protein